MNSFLYSMFFFFILIIIISYSWLSSKGRRLVRLIKRMGKERSSRLILKKSAGIMGEIEKAVEDFSGSILSELDNLELLRKRMEAVFSSMAEGVLAVDQEGKIIFVNPIIENFSQMTEPEILGKTVLEIIRNNEIASLVEKTLASGSRAKEEVKIFLPEERSFIIEASPMADKGAVCVIYDITELRKLEGCRSEFAANVSHELKTPLTAIKNYVDTLLSGAIDDKDHNLDFLRKIEKHTDNLSSLIDDLLEIARLESKKETGAFDALDLRKIMGRALETISSKAKRKNISLEFEATEEGYAIFGIEDHVYRAVLNLLDNAVNYTDSAGRVRLACERSAKTITITVTDTGIGIAGEHLPRLFERFFRIDGARSRELGGTGLGLAIVKHVMNLHNGYVSVESEPGKGTKFTLTFPAKQG